MCEVAITLRADLDTICCMKGKISAAKTGTSHSIKNGEYLSGRCVGNDEMGYAYQLSVQSVLRSSIVFEYSAGTCSAYGR